MTVTLIKPVPRWGVQFEGSPSPDHVDVRADETDARRWLHALRFCGNHDAALVRWDGADWVAVAVTQ